MKKFLAIFLVLTLLFSFAACNKDGNGDESSTTPTDQSGGTENTTKPEKPTAPPFDNPNLTVPEALFDIISVDDYDLKSRKPNTSASTGETTISKRYELKQKKSTTIPNSIKMESVDIVLKQTAVKDIVSQGWTAIGSTDLNKAVKVGRTATAFLKNDQDKMVKFDVVNDTANVVAVNDCKIVGISVFKNMDVGYDWVDFVVGDKVGTESSYAEFVAGFGLPAAINVTEFYQKNDYVKCQTSLLYGCKSGDTTYTVSIGINDENGKAIFDHFIVTAK